MMKAKPRIALEIPGGLRICVPADLECVTTYVLLEQQAWFEKEADFACRHLTPGMTAIDVGANYGVYSLPMARAVGPSGRVIAYEPSAATADFLDESAALNRFGNLSVVRRALSSLEGEGLLIPGGEGSETNALSAGPVPAEAGERVDVSTLDAESRRLGWDEIDFIKIDAEGEEARIIEGGRATLLRASPLVMFEVSVREQIDPRPIEALRKLGYDIYRLLGGGGMIVPWEGEHLDVWELNLFAAKSDRARMLESRRLLATGSQVPADIRGASPVCLRRAAWLAGFGIDPAPNDPQLMTGLAAYDIWRDPARSSAERYGALRLAVKSLGAAADVQPNPERLSTRARIAWEAGQRGVAMRCLGELLSARALPTAEAFLPASPRFDALAPRGRLQEWFLGAALEQAEILRAHSSYFAPSDIAALAWACRTPFVSPQIPRRLALQAARDGHPVPQALRALLTGPGHLNPEVFDPERLVALARV